MSHIPAILAGLALAIAAIPAAAQDLTTGAATVRDKALKDPTAWNMVSSLTTEIGARPIGSPAMTRARDWGVATLTAMGFQNVHTEAFTVNAWTRGEESAEVVSPFPQKLQILGLGQSTPTPKGGLTAEIVVFPTYQAMLDPPPGALKGKIAVVIQKMERTQDGWSGYGAINPMRFAGPSEAAKRGAVAYLMRSLSTDDTRLPHTGAALPGGIPAAALSTPDADLLERMAATGKAVSVRLSMTSSVNPKAEAWNVVGDLPGATPEMLVVGGHLDSWDPGTGAIDDASGVAILTAAAKLASADNPRRAIRVVMWGSEEQGGAGAAYAAAHKVDIPNIALTGESDLGADNIFSVSLPAGSLDHPAMKAFEAAIAPLKVIVNKSAPHLGNSDIEGLMEAGTPFVDFNQDANRYFDLHHSADDTLDKIDPAELAQNVAVWASFLYTVAHSDIDFRKLSAPKG